MTSWQYPVLSDSGMKVSKLFGISQGLFGIARISRVTFVIDKKGVVRQVKTLVSIRRYTDRKQGCSGFNNQFWGALQVCGQMAA